jgi:predicted amidohydrolase
MNRADVHGSLAPGRNGEAGVFDLVSGNFSYEDMDAVKRTVNQRFVPLATVMRGQVEWVSTLGRDLRRREI